MVSALAAPPAFCSTYRSEITLISDKVSPKGHDDWRHCAINTTYAPSPTTTRRIPSNWQQQTREPTPLLSSQKFSNNSAGNRTSIETTSAVKRHAKAQVPTNWTRSRIPPPSPVLPFIGCGEGRKRSIPTESKVFLLQERERERERERQKEQRKRDRFGN
ncbi:uncharacterized protein V6R79_000246 [Siganus canaliculatus]